MKRVFFSFLAGLALMATPVAKADNVTVEQAQDAAVHFLLHNTCLKGLQSSDLILVRQMMNTELQVPSMYIFNVSEGGWIAIAASTAMEGPIVAFDDEFSFDTSHLPPAAETWLQLYNQIICDVQQLDAEKGLPNSEDWEDLANHRLTGNTKDVQQKFLTASWDQGDYKGNLYNMFAPKAVSSAPGGYYTCPTGCVATAVAMICHYYKFPSKPRGLCINSFSWSAGRIQVGSNTYWTYQSGGRTDRMNFNDSAAFDYSVMPDALTARSSLSSRREVSRLGWYVGAAVKMEYAPDGSSSNSSKVQEGMPQYFKYKAGTYSSRRTLTTNLYMSRLRSDLLKKRPVYMEGHSSVGEGRDAGGHAWLCVGYMEEDSNFYYMNWGWGGSSNGWFNLRSNTVNDMYTGEYAFTEYQAHITGMIPEGDSVGINEVKEIVSLGAAYPNPATYSVKIPYSTSSVGELTIYNALGQPVERRRVQAGNGELAVRVDAMPKGIYIYRMGDAFGKFVVR